MEEKKKNNKQQNKLRGILAVSTQHWLEVINLWRSFNLPDNIGAKNNFYSYIITSNKTDTYWWDKKLYALKVKFCVLLYQLTPINKSLSTSIYIYLAYLSISADTCLSSLFLYCSLLWHKYSSSHFLWTFTKGKTDVTAQINILRWHL